MVSASAKDFPPFRLDPVNQCLWRRQDAGEDERVLLTPKAFAVLGYLVEHPGRLVTQDELLDAVWPDTFVQPEVLKYQIADIRNTLGDPARNPHFIETLPRRGYRFVAAVSERATAEAWAPASPDRGRLVGRERELGALRACLRKALKGQRQIVFITGEPGIGKTALVDEFQRLAAAEEPNLRIARGQCVEGYGGMEAYYPMLEALGQLCHGSGGKRVVEILAAQAPTWLVQFPVLLNRDQRQMLQREIQGATRERMLREIREALDTLNLEAPLLWVFEDLQWVDPSTVDLISALARQRTTAKAMVIITKRPVDMVAPEHPLKRLKQDLLVHHLCQEMTLTPMTKADVAEYLGAESPGGSLPQGFAELIHRHSEGNPLFMIAALEHMTEHGQISRENGKWRLRIPIEEMALEVPETLRQMIESQIEHLTNEQQRTLEVASVNGVLFSASVNAIPASLDEEKFEDLCDELSRRHHMVRWAGSRQFPDGTVSVRYEFTHALYREVFYHRQTPGRRAKLHLRVGERLEELFSKHESEVAAELAGHFEQGGDWQRAIKYLRLAADKAGRRFEPRQATAILEHALELAKKLPDAERAPSETGILETLAGIYAALADIRVSETYAALSERAAHYGLIDVEVRALIERAFIESVKSSERGLELLEQALHVVRTSDPMKHLPAYADCLSFRLWLCGLNPQDAEECRNAIGEIRKMGDPRVVAPHLLDYSCIQWCSSEYRESHRSYTDGLKMLLDADSVHPSLSGFQWGLWQHFHLFDLIFLGEWGDASREIEEAITMANKNGDYFHRPGTLQLCRAWLHLQACDFAGVLTICESAVPLVRDPVLRAAPGSPPPYPWPFQQSLVLRGSAEAALGEYDRAREYLFAARDDMDRRSNLNDWYWRMPPESGLTELWLAEGNLAQARLQAERFLSVTLTAAERTWQALAWEANARVAVAERDAPRAQDCIAKALSTMEGFELPLASWRVHSTASEFYRNSGDRDLAERHLALSRETIMKLANSLPEDEPLRRTFLSAPMVRKILGAGETPGSRAREA
jgi:DNA-binding winged helix-turn-helix (wHTH) protein/tetratricopeptide (TPR) repeat protein